MDSQKNFWIKPTLKVIVLGDSGVGKTSIVNRFTGDDYLPKPKATVGVDFKSKNIVYNNFNVTLQFWDTAGQEKFESVADSYYRGADCCILVYDVTEKSSFSRLQVWKEKFLFHASLSKYDDFPFIVMGNKIDKGCRAISNEVIEGWKEMNKDISHFEVSAKEDINIRSAFNIIPELVMQEKFVNDKCNNINLQTISLIKNRRMSMKKSSISYCCCC
uniref:Rab family GTPase n=1 Tax=Strongyloides stercoralis TaxID=6248 RepID=A0A0K0EQG1_STRER